MVHDSVFGNSEPRTSFRSSPPGVPSHPCSASNRSDAPRRSTATRAHSLRGIERRAHPILAEERHRDDIAALFEQCPTAVRQTWEGPSEKELVFVEG